MKSRLGTGAYGVAFAVSALCVLSLGVRADAVLRSAGDPVAAPRVANVLDTIPLGFEANEGQTDQRVRFLSRGRGYERQFTGLLPHTSAAPKMTPRGVPLWTRRATRTWLASPYPVTFRPPLAPSRPPWAPSKTRS